MATIMDPIKMAESRISCWLRGQMAMKRLKQEDCAKVIHTTQGSYSRKLNLGDFSFAEIIALANKYDFDLDSLMKTVR